jgi:hypothetical protein
LGRKNGHEAEFVGSGNIPHKENWDDPECEAGEYYVMINTPWRSITREFSFSVYGPGLTDLERVSEDDLPKDFLRNVFKSKAKSDIVKRGNDFAHRNHPGIKYVSGEKNGWAYMYFENKEDSHEIKVTLKLGASNAGVKVMPPHEGNRPSMTVGPGEDNIIVYKSNGPKSVSVSIITSFNKIQKKDNQGSGGKDRIVKPNYGGRRVVRPYQPSWDNGRVIRPSQPSGGRSSYQPPRDFGDGSRILQPDDHQPSGNDADIMSKARNSSIILSKNQNNQPVDINMHFLYHPQGLALLYVNNTRDKTLNEHISFNLRNAHIQGTHGNSVEFTLGPGQEKLIQLVRNNNQTFEAKIEKILYEISGGNSNPVRHW